MTAAEDAHEDSGNAQPKVFNDFSRHPPIEKFITLNGMLKGHAAEAKRKPLICYPREGVADFEEYTAAQIDAFAEAAAQFYIEHGLEPADPTAKEAPVVALLSHSNFEVIVTIFALNRLGYAIFFLSTRLGPAAHARLLGLAECYKVITPEALLTTVEEICEHRPGCSRVPIIQRKDYGSESARPFKRILDDAVEGNKMAFILHSSGSTGFPKPIFLTNLQCLANFRKSFGMRAFTTSPLFHSHGLMELFRAFYTRSTMYLYNYSLPITSKNLMEALSVAKPELVAAVPYVLKLLAEKPEGVQMLAKANIVIYGGSSCPDDLGDRLVREDVNLVANYGATETGQIMTSFRSPGDNEWQYMRLHQPVADHTLMDEIAPGVFECVGLHGLPSKGPSNSKPPFSDKNPPNSFRTADLFTRHPDPEKSNYYKYLSRLDDRITLVNGEKVLPIPIENRIRQENLVREAAVFGFERTVPGALIFRSSDHGTELTDEQYLEAVWPAVEAANIAAETFSRIPKELVVIKGADVVYPRTDKGTFIRAQVYQQFAQDISEAYKRFESGSEKSGGLRLNIIELQEWLLRKFRDDLGVPIPDIDTDIFSAGVDSLQTTRIWRAIRKDLDLGSGSQTLGQNIVFEKGTIRALARHLYHLRTGGAGDNEQDELSVMRELIDKYSTFIDHIPSDRPHPGCDVVILTGATGNLGAYIIHDLLQRPTVSEVWALVRAPLEEAAGLRIMETLRSRDLLLPSECMSKMIPVPSDFSQPDLGLKPERVERLLNTATCIVHSAWAVNFNLGVRSFEEQHIRGTYNLVNLCLRSRLSTPAKFFFCSSVSTASSTPKPAVILERAIEDLSHAQNTGYGRSKLVTEHIIRNAMRSTGMHARVLRIGQLSGDKKNASWNDTEAVALMVRSALTVGALPALNENISWLPVDSCAKAVVDLSLGPSAPQKHDAELVYHLVNPKTFHWTKDFLPALQQRTALPQFEIVSPQEWLRRLEQSEQDPVKNPSIKLVDFWRKKYGTFDAPAVLEVDDAPSGLTFETTRTIQDYPALGQEIDPVSAGLAERYVNVWLESWRK